MIKTVRSVGAVLTLGVLSLHAAPIHLSATTSGSATPATSTTCSSISNGGFTIIPIPICSVPVLLGDGHNEITQWAFNLTADPDFALFNPSAGIQSAVLTLTLIAGHVSQFTNDFVAFETVFGNTGKIVPPSIGTLVFGSPVTISLNLLDFRTSAELVALITSNSGAFPVLYADDALVAGATIELVSDVPEPRSFSMVLSVLSAIWFLRRRLAHP